jgi:hypothetical protein
MSRTRMRLPAAWLAVAVALSLAVLSASFFHTDDGCRVEIHCLACRASVGRASTGAALPAAVRPVLVVGPGVPDAVVAPAEAVRLPQLPSRAPPRNA